MNIQSEKIRLIEQIAHITDADIIKQLREILGSSDNPTIGYDIEGNVITASHLEEDLKKAKKRYKAGKFTTQTALENEVKKW